MKRSAMVLAFIISLVFSLSAGEKKAQDKPQQPEKSEAEQQWNPPTDEEMERLEKAEEEKLAAQEQRWRIRLENAGVSPGEIEKKLAEAKRRWKKESAFRIELAKLPPEERREAIIDHSLEDVRARLEKEGFSGEALEKEIALERDEIEQDLAEQDRVEAMPIEEKRAYLLEKKEEEIRQRLSAAGLEGEELENALRRTMDLHRQEIEHQLAEGKGKPGHDTERAGTADRPGPRLAKKDIENLERLRAQWKEKGLSDEEIEQRSQRWRRQRLAEKSNPAAMVVEDLKKSVAELQKQLRQANKKLNQLTRTVKEQSGELAEIRRLLEEIRKELMIPGAEEPELPEVPPLEPDEEGSEKK